MNGNTILILSAALILQSSVAHAQESRPKRTSALLSMNVQIEGAEIHAEAKGSTFRFYSLPAEIIASIGFFNGPEKPVAPIVVDVPSLRNHLRISLHQERDLGAIVQWFPLHTNGPVSLAGERGVALRASISLARGRLTPGTYTIRVELENAAAVASSKSEVPLILPGGPMVASVAIVDPQTPEDRAAAARQLGRAALKKGDMQTAEEHFRRAVDMQLGASANLDELGSVLLRRGKYREAIECFERIVPTPLHEPSFVPQMLAEAYIGVGDDARAAQVLRRTGLSPERLATEMEQLRQNVSRRTP